MIPFKVYYPLAGQAELLETKIGSSKLFFEDNFIIHIVKISFCIMKQLTGLLLQKANFPKRSQLISIKFPLHKQSVNPIWCYKTRHATVRNFTRDSSLQDLFPMTLEVRAHENFLRRSWEFVGILPTLPNRIPLPNHTVSQFSKFLSLSKLCQVLIGPHFQTRKETV